MDKEKKCSLPTEVYSRVVGYFRPVQHWNEGKKEEFKDRKTYTAKEDA
ncbi:anaerobic ribonucleoside-triphosphate reductase [Candidatus Margulisiibacteriota bacterium]